MVDEKDQELETETGQDGGDTQVDQGSQDAGAQPQSVRESIQAAVKEETEKAAGEEKPKKPIKDPVTGKFTSGAKEGDTENPADKELPTEVKDGKAASPQAAASEPPSSWSKESKALWKDLPPQVQAEVSKREADTARGVQELKARYGELDKALEPLLPAIKQAGRTPGQTVERMTQWYMALAHSDKNYARAQLLALAKDFGIDVSDISQPKAGAEAAKPVDASTDSKPVAAIPPEFDAKLKEISKKFETLEEAERRRNQEKAEADLNAWMKDKPHFEAVRGHMAQLINADLAAVQAGSKPLGGYVKEGGAIDLDAAYQAAIFANPEIRQKVLDEERVKFEAQIAKAAAEKEKARKAEVARARNAGSSLRPSPGPSGNGAGKPPVRESVRDSIKRALVETSQA